MPIPRPALPATIVLLAAAAWAPALHAQAPAPSSPAHTAKAAPAAKAEAAAKPAESPAVFPTARSPKYASEKAGTARMHTCLDQYHANKTTHANGGLNWIQKGGGYYSLCLKAMKT